MPSKKQEKRRRKLRVHGPSADAVGAPPAKRKEPRPSSTPARGQRGQRGGREPAIPSLRRSARKGAFMALFMVGIVVVTTRSHGTTSVIIALAETIPLVFLFVWFDLWMARKVYKRVTGQEAPREPRAERGGGAGAAGFGGLRRRSAERDADAGAAEDSDGLEDVVDDDFEDDDDYELVDEDDAPEGPPGRARRR
jgi:hypothetical protein